MRFSVLALLFAVFGCTTPMRPTTRPVQTTETPERSPTATSELATWPRTDPPPFPVEELVRVVQPLGANLPPAQLAQIASFIRWYERDPFDPTIGLRAERGVRFTLLAWVSESPEVHITTTTFLNSQLEGRGGDEELLSSSATVGSIFGMAADAIERPSHAPESAERQTAGIESALRWYEAALARGAARNGFLDELIQVRNQGNLVQWFQERVTVRVR